MRAKKQRLKSIKPVDPRAVQLLGQADRGEITCKSALLQLGVSEKQTNKAWKLVASRRSLREALAVAKSEKLHQLRSDDAVITTEQDISLINNRLRNNVKKGEDKATASSKLLGSRRDLNLWTPEQQTGILIMQVRDDLPPLPAEIQKQFEANTAKQEGTDE